MDFILEFIVFVIGIILLIVFFRMASNIARIRDYIHSFRVEMDQFKRLFILYGKEGKLEEKACKNCGAKYIIHDGYCKSCKKKIVEVDS